MIQKLEILDETLNSLDYINNKRFSSEKFKEVNSQFEKILMELKSNEETLKINKSSQEFINMFNNILNKIDMLEAKILPKANLFDSFSKSKLNSRNYIQTLINS
jgi:hypothetical protein